MATKVVLIHGWSADSGSMRDVGSFLREHGRDTEDVWLSDYISLADDVNVADVARRMHDVLGGLAANLGAFDIVLHSTGGLVVREWLSRFHPDGAGCPAKRIVMLAPANFGSRLAAAGKSFIGRVVKGWDSWFQTGTQMLNNLELASEYQWRLAQRDLLAPEGGTSPYGPGKVLPFVIVGSRGHTQGLEQLADELGSDGVVRASAASLKAVGLTLTFSDDANPPAVRPWLARDGAVGIPLAVLPNRNHGTITQPRTRIGAFLPQLGELILEALDCPDTPAAYAAVDAHWRQVSGATHGLEDVAVADPDHPPNRAGLDRYLQVVVHVRDDQGNDVNDYFVEFYDPEKPDDEQDTVILHRQVIKDTHIYSQNPSYRCFFVDRTALLNEYYAKGYETVAMSISAAKLGDHVAYFNTATATAAGHAMVSTKAGATAASDADKNALQEFLREDRTHLIEIVIPRAPVPDLFRMSAPPYAPPL